MTIKPTGQMDLAELEALQTAMVEQAKRDGLVGAWSIGGETDTVDTLAGVGPSVAQSQLNFLRTHHSGRGGKTYDTPFVPSASQHVQMVEAQKVYLRSYRDFMQRRKDGNG